MRQTKRNVSPKFKDNNNCVEFKCQNIYKIDNKTYSQNKFLKYETTKFCLREVT